MKFISLSMWIIALVLGLIVVSNTISIGAHSKIIIEKEDQNIERILKYSIENRINSINPEDIQRANEYLKGILINVNNIYGNSFKLFIILLIGTLVELLKVILSKKKVKINKENLKSI